MSGATINPKGFDFFVARRRDGRGFDVLGPDWRPLAKDFSCWRSAHDWALEKVEINPSLSARGGGE
jgi:hypothetical protein